ncbi:response regulator transcription factor [Candidatus Solincola sp.]|nr:response regulator transcription factor [Actinomycetota bacterium]MDI7252074.1 response regulator transcription factor [Actinomycetota bacterium]
MRKELILVVDDDRDIANVLRAYLEKEGYPTLTAFDGETALRLWRENRPSLVVLDVRVPGLGGYAFCREVRKYSDVPIIMLSASAEEEDRVLGLELGADDYLAKPFSPRELVARIRAILRRCGEEAGPEAVLSAGPLLVDGKARGVLVFGKEVALTPREFDILALLASQPEKVFTREEILAAVGEEACAGHGRIVDSHIKNLRRKLRNAAEGWNFIDTVHGVGYRFRAIKTEAAS